MPVTVTPCVVAQNLISIKGIAFEIHLVEMTEPLCIEAMGLEYKCIQSRIYDVSGRCCVGKSQEVFCSFSCNQIQCVLAESEVLSTE